MSCVFALCVFPSKHGTEFPDIYSLSDFADFVSDMSWKGNCPVCFQIITIRLPLNKDGVFKRDPMIHSCINCRLKANVVTYSNTKFMRLTLATVFCVCVFPGVTLLPICLFLSVQVRQPVICANHHVFCSSCMEMWLKKANQCPTCRVPITAENPCREIIGE